ncbi:MAG: hypothetical protein RIA71_00095 [Oceanicaulis sp.]
MDAFSDLFSSYWWLLFPLFFFISAGWGSFMRYKRTQAKIDLLKSYAASGHEPPAALLADLDGRSGDDDEDAADGGGGSAAPFLVVLFAGLAGVFAFAGYTGLMGEDGESFYFIALILGVLAVAFLVSGLFGRRR